MAGKMAAGDIVFIFAVSFLAGVFAGSTGWNFYLAVFAAASAAVFFLRKIWLGIIFLLFAFGFGFFYYHLFLNLREASTRIDLGREINFSGIVVSEPRKYEEVQVFRIKLLPPHEGKIEVLLPRANEVKYGDLLALRGEVEAPASAREMPTAFFPEMEIKARHRGFWLKRQLLIFKDALVYQFHRFLPADSAALASGLTFGVRSDFSSDFKKAMTQSGTTHLVALSGYNISILVLAIFNTFGRWLPRRATFILTTVFIILFVVMTGGEASIFRAGIMGFLALLAKESGRQYSFRNAIALTAFGMTVFDPAVLAYDVGFQLSFLSLLGLVYLMPALAQISGWGRKDAGFLSWRENLLTTVCAQIAVLPVLLHRFREFSFLGVAANTLILGFVPYTMFLSFVLAGLGLVSYYLGLALAWLVNALLIYEISVIKLFAALPSVLRAEAGPVFILAYYAAVAAFITWRNSKNLKNNVSPAR
jgi:competence protein ComEC